MSSNQPPAASPLDSSAQPFSVLSLSSFEFKPEVSDFIPQSGSVQTQSPSRSYGKRKGSSSKRSPNFRPRTEPFPELQAAPLLDNFPALPSDPPVKIGLQGMWEDAQRLKIRPESEEFVPRGEATEFVPNFSFATDLNVAASEFVPNYSSFEFVPSADNLPPPVPSDKPPTPPPVSRPEAEAKSPEPSEPQKLPPTDAAETGSSESEPQKLDFQLIPDSSFPNKVYSPELIHRVGLEDRTRVVTLERVRILMGRSITESTELRKQFMRRPPQRPEIVQTGMQRAQEVQQSPAAVASPWRMERTMEQVSAR